MNIPPRHCSSQVRSPVRAGPALPELPFGGLRDSGQGTKGVSEAIMAYLETKLITRKEFSPDIGGISHDKG